MGQNKLTHGKRSLAFVLMLLMVFSSFSMLGTLSASAANDDLSVSDVNAVVSQIYDGDKVVLTATLRNNGDAAITGATVRFSADGRVLENVKKVDIPGGGIGVPIRTSKKYSAWFGSHKLKATIVVDGANATSRSSRIVVIDGKRPEVVIPDVPADQKIIINQVYGGGGKGDTIISNSFIELYNTTDKEIDLNGYTVNYISNRPESYIDETGAVSECPASTKGEVRTLTLTGKIPSHGSYLIRCKEETRSAAAPALVLTIDKGDQDWDQYIDNKQFNIVLKNADGTQLDAITALNESDISVNVDEAAGEGLPFTDDFSKKNSLRRVDFKDTDNNSVDFVAVKWNKATEDVIKQNKPHTSDEGSWADVKEVYDETPLAQPATEPATKGVDAYNDVSGNVGKESTNGGYTGNGYVNYIKDRGPATFNVNVDEAGKYAIKFRYSTSSSKGNSGAATSNATISVNGANYDYTLTQFGNTYNQSYWDSWRWTDPVVVNMNAGNNTVNFTAPGWDYNLDTFTIEKVYDQTITSFSFLKANNPNLKGDINCDIGYGKITATIPANMDVSKLIATFTTANGATVTAKTKTGEVQESDVNALNYTNGMTIYCGGVEYSVVLSKVQGDNLPSVFVEFDSKVTADQKNMLLNSTSTADKETKVKCTVSLDASDAKLPTNLVGYSESTKLKGFDNVSGSTIKLRGNSTIIDAEKKSYTIKLGTKSAALDMPKHKTWVLVGCFDDKTMMRQYFGYQMANYFSQTNGDWSVKQRFAQVWMDGKYLGTYMFGESIKVDSGRVAIQDNDDVEQTKDESGNVISEKSLLTNVTNDRDYENLSFIVEKDNRDTSDPLYINAANYGWIITTPEDQILAGGSAAETYKNCIKNYLGDALGSLGGNYWEWIDVESFVDWYLLFEVMKTIDAGTGYSSVYLTKDAATHVDAKTGENISLNGGKLTCGPAWDFNPGSGNANYDAAAGYNNNTDGYWIKTDRYFWNTLFNNGNTIADGGKYNGKTFKQAVIERRNELCGTDGYLGDAKGQISTIESYLANAMKDNYKRWDYLDTYAWPQPTIYHSYSAEVNAFSNWMNSRVNWLKNQNFN